MKISFTTPTTYTDGTAIPATEAAKETFALFIDTVNPPLKSYPVPAALVAAGKVNADGSIAVTVDTVVDLKLAPVPGTTYFVAAQDAIGSVKSDSTSVVSYVYTPKPSPPSVPTVA